MFEHRLRMAVRILKQSARRASCHQVLPFPTNGEVLRFTLRKCAGYFQCENGLYLRTSPLWPQEPQCSRFGLAVSLIRGRATSALWILNFPGVGLLGLLYWRCHLL